MSRQSCPSSYGRQVRACLSTGDLFRAAVDDPEDALGREAAAYLAAGRFVPDALVVDLVLARLGGADAARAGGVLLDGFPRTAAQVKAPLSLRASIRVDPRDAASSSSSSSSSSSARRARILLRLSDAAPSPSPTPSRSRRVVPPWYPSPTNGQRTPHPHPGG